MKLLIGGSPCTNWSIARKGRETQPEGIGWELFDNYQIARDKFRPEYFLYENNKSIAGPIREQITAELGVEPILINSARVSAQSRQRLYWTNIPDVKQPEDRGIILRDILESGVCWREKAYTLMAAHERSVPNAIARNGKYPFNGAAEPVNITTDGKAKCLRASYFKDGIRNLVGNTIDQKTCVAEPVRVGTIESGTKTNHDSKPFRVYSPDGKAVTLQGEAGGYGAKTGLYAVPVNPSEFARGGGCCLPYKFRCRRTNDSGNRGPRPRDL